jgi:Cu/Ag efflux protein CusF
MASLTGSFIKDTYQSLLKLIDNGNVTSTAKEITDGEGNGTGISIDTSGNVTATGTVQGSSVTNGTTSISDLQTNKEDKSEKGAASGYAPLDVNSKVPTANLPDSVVGQVEYKGTWNAETNTPTLPSASGVKGNYYVVSVAGVYETVDYEIGDWIISNGTQWEKVDNSDKVSSVNGATGAVVLDTDNISEGSTNQYYTSERANSDFDTRLATKDTDDLSEGSNLYYTEARVSANVDVTANTAKVGITQEQADAIVANTAKNSYPSADALKLSGIEEGAEVNVQSDWNASNGDAFILNKPTTITTQQADDITANNAKVSFPEAPNDGDAYVRQSEAWVSLTHPTDSVTSVNTQTGVVVLDTDDIDEGATNLYYTDARVSANTDVAANTAKVGITTQQASDITANNAKISFDSASSTKLAGIEEGAEVNVNADWNATEGDAQILNKPTLATVATSGSYTDLSNTPTIPTNNNELTNGAGYITDGNTGWDNTYGFITASTTDTLTNKSGNNSQWTNDAGYINEAAQTSHTNAIGNAIDFSARVTLAGGVAEGTSGIIKNLQSIS